MIFQSKNIDVSTFSALSDYLGRGRRGRRGIDRLAAAAIRAVREGRPHRVPPPIVHTLPESVVRLGWKFPNPDFCENVDHDFHSLVVQAGDGYWFSDYLMYWVTWHLLRKTEDAMQHILAEIPDEYMWDLSELYLEDIVDELIDRLEALSFMHHKCFLITLNTDQIKSPTVSSTAGSSGVIDLGYPTATAEIVQPSTTGGVDMPWKIPHKNLGNSKASVKMHLIKDVIYHLQNNLMRPCWCREGASWTSERPFE